MAAGEGLEVSVEPAGLARLADWILGCQYREVHPYTSAAPGGWGWTDLSGAVPDADDTPGALVALAAMRKCPSLSPVTAARIDRAAVAGLGWLAGLQNSDGGWPTFCRGWGNLPFDRSGADLTAHVLRAIRAWQKTPAAVRQDARLVRKLLAARRHGFRFLNESQRPDGSWIPLWFGNEHHPEETNPVYGTARVLLAYRDVHRMDSAPARAAFPGWPSTASRMGAGARGSVRAVACPAWKRPPWPWRRCSRRK